MAAANAILRSKRAKQLMKKETLERSSSPQDDSDSSASSSPTKSLVLNVESGFGVISCTYIKNVVCSVTILVRTS
jgi:hypothetical protein